MIKIKLSKDFNPDHINLGNGLILFQGDEKVYDVTETPQIKKALFEGSIEEVTKCEKDDKDKTCVEVKDGNEVWVFAEQRDGKIMRVTYELLGKALELSTQLGVKTAAVLIGEEDKFSKDLIASGADKVYVIEDKRLKHYMNSSYTKALSELIKKHDPQIVLFGATVIGRDLAPRAARRIGTGLTADCTGLEIDDDGYLAQTRPAWGGNLMATIKCTDTMPQMSTVRPGVMKAIEPDKQRKGEIVKVSTRIDDKDLTASFISFEKGKKKIANLEDADIIVSGGRGLGDKKNFELIKELAGLLDAEIGASRGVVDEGWIEQDHQVGQTGKTVRPKIYLAFGISGAIQHRAGMQDSDLIIAINKDPNAMIFSIADYGIIADVNEFIPEMIKELKK